MNNPGGSLLPTIPRERSQLNHSALIHIAVVGVVCEPPLHRRRCHNERSTLRVPTCCGLIYSGSHWSELQRHFNDLMPIAPVWICVAKMTGNRCRILSAEVLFNISCSAGLCDRPPAGLCPLEKASGGFSNPAQAERGCPIFAIVLWRGQFCATNDNFVYCFVDRCCCNVNNCIIYETNMIVALRANPNARNGPCPRRLAHTGRPRHAPPPTCGYTGTCWGGNPAYGLRFPRPHVAGATTSR